MYEFAEKMNMAIFSLLKTFSDSVFSRDIIEGSQKRAFSLSNTQEKCSKSLKIEKMDFYQIDKELK